MHMSEQGLKMEAIKNGVRNVLESAIAKSLDDFIGTKIDKLEDVTSIYIDSENRLKLPSGIFSQMGFGNSLSEGALIFRTDPDTLHQIAPGLLPEGNVRLAVDVLGELSNLVGGLILNESFFKDPYDSFTLAPPIKFENKGDVKYFENMHGVSLILNLSINGCEVLAAFLLRDRKSFYNEYPCEGCNPVSN